MTSASVFTRSAFTALTGLWLGLASPGLQAEETDAPADTVETASAETEEPPLEETAEADDITAETEDPENEDSSARVIPPRHIPYPHASRHLAIQTHLSDLQRSDEVVQLIHEEQSFYGLYLPGRSAEPQGGVLILHDLEQHGHWPVLVGPLRENLPEHGWATLAVELPSPYRTTSTVRPVSETANPPPEESDETEEEITPEALPQDTTEVETTDPAGPSAGSSAAETDADTETDIDPDNEPPLPPLEGLPPLPASEESPEVPDEAQVMAFDQQVTARIIAGLQYLADRGQLNQVIIAIGDSAPLAANAVAVWQRERQAEQGISLVMVDARENPYTQLPLTDTLRPLELPVLDLITSDNQMTDWQLQSRRGMMKRLHNDNYWQIRQNSASADATTTTRRIRGWLKKHAAGTELR